MKKISVIAWIIFLLSVMALVVLVPSLLGSPAATPPPIQLTEVETAAGAIKVTQAPGTPAPPATLAPTVIPTSVPSTTPPETMTTIIIPAVTALTSLLTALTTSYLSIRQRRMEDKKTELELEKMKLDLLRLKKEISGPDPQTTSKQ